MGFTDEVYSLLRLRQQYQEWSRVAECEDLQVRGLCEETCWSLGGRRRCLQDGPPVAAFLTSSRSAQRPADTGWRREADRRCARDCGCISTCMQAHGTYSNEEQVLEYSENDHIDEMRDETPANDIL